MPLGQRGALRGGEESLDRPGEIGVVADSHVAPGLQRPVDGSDDGGPLPIGLIVGVAGEPILDLALAPEGVSSGPGDRLGKLTRTALALDQHVDGLAGASHALRDG